MSNYVFQKVICEKETFEKWFLDDDPFGDQKPLPRPYISFNKLFDAASIGNDGKKLDVSVYNGFGFSWEQREDGLYEFKFTTRWQYPIRAIIKALTLSHEIVWYAVEENHEYLSKFYWRDGVKEDVFLLRDAYFAWSEEHASFCDSLEDCDDPAWYYLLVASGQWQNWESTDQFSRYVDVPAHEVSCPVLQR